LSTPVTRLAAADADRFALDARNARSSVDAGITACVAMVSTASGANLGPGNRVDRPAIEDGLRAAGSEPYRRSWAHRQIAAQRQRLEQRVKPELACEGTSLRGLAGSRCTHARHSACSQDRNGKCRGAARSAQLVVNALVAVPHCGSSASYAAAHLEVDAPACGVEIDLLDLPGWRQSKCMVNRVTLLRCNRDCVIICA